MTVANIASLIDVMDLKYNEYRKKLNVWNRQSKVLNRRTNKTLTNVKGQQTAN
jgi:antitoxin component HigA of HigAB toxin-antitoxin module